MFFSAYECSPLHDNAINSVEYYWLLYFPCSNYSHIEITTTEQKTFDSKFIRNILDNGERAINSISKIRKAKALQSYMHIAESRFLDNLSVFSCCSIVSFGANSVLHVFNFLHLFLFCFLSSFPVKYYVWNNWNIQKYDTKGWTSEYIMLGIEIYNISILAA